MSGGLDDESPGRVREDASAVATMDDLAQLLRRLRRREARQRGDAELTYRELAARTGWSHAIIGEYLTGRILPPTDRFDALIHLLGATPLEKGALATARDRVEETRRAAERTGAPIAPAVPRQLPPAVRDFSGRAAELARLTRLREPGTGTIVISAIDGTAGVGKTSLALHWAHQIADEFPDGQLCLNLRGFDPVSQPMTAAEAVRACLDAFGVAAHRVPAGLEAQVGLYRSIVADRRVLVVLDNARDADQIRPLVPASPGSLVVVTSRNRLPGLVATDTARPLTLDLLTAGEARELLSSRLGSARIEAEPAAVDEIVERCARLPLALTIVAARAESHPTFPLAALAAELRTGLDAFATADGLTDVRAVFSWSYRSLSQPAARLFRLLGLLTAAEVDAPAAASLAAVPMARARTLLGELSNAHLVAERAPGRFTLHDLLRAYATELADSRENKAGRQAAQRRLLDHFVHTAYAAARLLNPHMQPIPLSPPEPGAFVRPFTDAGEARAWFATERTTLLAAVDRAAEAGFDVHAWQLARTLMTYLDHQGYWHEWVASQRVALVAAQRLGDPVALAQTHRGLGRAYAQLDRLDEALSHLGQALERNHEQGDLLGQAQCRLDLAMICLRQERHVDALEHDRAALDLYRTAGDLYGQANALNAIGWCHGLMGDFLPALARCHEALPLLVEIGNRAAQADTWDSLGYIHHQLGAYDDAAECYLRAIELYHDIGNRHPEAESLIALGDTYKLAGHGMAARDAWERAASVLDELGHASVAQVRARLDPVG